jgi:AraC family transcriptional regulator
MRLAPGTFLGNRLALRTGSGIIATEYSYAPQAKLRRHSHELPYFSFVLAGSYDERRSDSRGWQCLKETVLFHALDETHDDHFGNQNTRLFSLEVGLPVIERAREYDLQVDEPLKLTSSVAKSLSWRAYKVFSKASAMAALELEALAFELLCELPWKQARAPESHVPAWLKRAREILHDEFPSPFSLSCIAHRVGVHPVHLARSFRRQHGVSMGAYLRRIRVFRATEELLRGKSSLCQIAAKTGFSDQSHFGRVFRATTGMTPGEFRSKGGCFPGSGVNSVL